MKELLKIKICGMRYPENIEAVAQYQPDFLGFIFYKVSKRDCSETLSQYALRNTQYQKVGVFVNESVQNIETIAKEFHLNYLQLHGDEAPEFCADLHHKGYKIIKAFGIDENFVWSTLNDYQPFCDYFLFDTKSVTYGGTGKKFDWKVLEGHKIDKPFFLSGGIGLEDIDEIKRLSINNLFAVDMNSKLEIEPGLKDIDLVEKAIYKTRKTGE